MRRSTNRKLSLGVMTTSLALLATACLQAGDEGNGGGAGAGQGSDDNDGVVEILGAFTGDEQKAFEETLEAWSAESGIEVNYTGNSDFTTFVRSRVKGGEAPDIALFPQPGLLLDLANSGDLIALDQVMDLGAVEGTLIPGFLDSATTEDGTVYGAPMRMAVKSIVWVPKDWYNQAGYTLEPANIDELKQVGDQIKGEGIAPWCLGYESGAATGWVGTDWIEEYMLRLHGPEVYDQWVAHEIPFNDPQVQEAFDAYAEIALEQGNVKGGPEAILSTPFGEAGNASFDDPPGCVLHRQGNFITGFFPDAVQDDLDASVDVMVFPPIEGGYDGQPILGGGDLAGVFNPDDDDTKAVMEFMTSDQFGAEWAQAGGWLSPHSTFDASNYPDETTRKIAELATSADVFRYDASDLMPAEVGADTFWKGMVDWTRGAKTTEQVTTDIENSWPQ